MLAMSLDQLPDPLVPPEVDLGGLDFMPMRHLKVLQSTLFVKSTGDEFKAAFALWCRSWTEVPAASLPNDEQMLEAFSCSKAWSKVRDRALHRWVLCSDNRWYHPVIAELALDAWERRDEFRVVQENKETRRDRYRERVKELSQKLRDLGVVPPRNVSLKKLEAALAEAESEATGRVDASIQASTEASTQASGSVPTASTQASTHGSEVDAVGMPLTVGEGVEGTVGGTDVGAAGAAASTQSRAGPVASDKSLGLEDLVAEGVDRTVAGDWLKVRRAKKAVLTRTAWEAIKREAAAAGLSPARAVKVSAENNWQGFKNTWYQNLGGGGAAQPAAPGKRGLGSRIQARLGGEPDQGVIDV